MNSFKEYLKNTNQYNDIRIIDKTPVGNFLDINNNINLQNALKRAFSNGHPEFDVIKEYGKRGSELNKFFYDAGKKDSGLWDIASKRFVAETKGEVITYIGKNANPDITFYQTELPEVLKNKDITKINGVEKTEFVSKLNIYDLDKNKLGFIKENSKEYHINDIIKNNKITYAYKIKGIASIFSQDNLPGALKILNKAGTTGLILGAGVASYEITQAIKDGDMKRASEVMGEYGASMGGGYLTAKVALATTGGAATLGTLLLTTAVSIGGSELALYLYKNRDILSYFINPVDDRWDGKTPFADFWLSMLKGEKSHKEISDIASYLFNPFDANWQGKDPEWLEEIKNFWSPHINNLGNDIYSTLQEAKNFWSQFSGYNLSISIYDPLALDLNADGKIGISPIINEASNNNKQSSEVFNNTSSNNNNQDKDISTNTGGVYFDHNADNISHKSSWIDKDDGILVHDRNNNGIIDNGNELFGNFTEIIDKEGNKVLAKDGFEALASLDSNNDGAIDINDKEFNNIKVWQDINQDGISQEEELKTLNELNISSLNLDYKEVNEDLGNKNTLTLKGSYTKVDGSTHTMADIDFNVDTIDSKFKDAISPNKEQSKRANVKGYGLLRDLKEASALNKELATILDSYQSLNTKEEQLSLLPDLIKAWSYTSVANGDIDTISSKDYDITLNHINLPSDVGVYAGASINIDSNGNVVSGSNNANTRRLKLTPNQYRALMNNQGSIDKALLDEFDTIKYKIRVIDSFTGRKTDNLYYTGNDDIRNIIDKTNQTYSEILSYTYNTLNSQTRLKEYISLIDIKAYETNINNSDDIRYTFKPDYTKVADRFKDMAKTNPKKAFVDMGELINVVLMNNNNTDTNLLIQAFSELIGYATKNNLMDEYKKELTTYQDISYIMGSKDIRGTNGNDTIFGSDSDDAIRGESGNDTLISGEGDDAYIFNRGDGNDIIDDRYGSNIVKFGESIAKSDIIASRIPNTNDLLLSIKDTNDSIKINNAYVYNNFKFSFSTLTLADINLEIVDNDESNTIRGYNSDDIIYGNGGDDIIDGYSGNDTIYGGNGNDKLYGNYGNDMLSGSSGNDTLYGGDENDTLYGGENDDILYGNSGNNKLYGESGPLIRTITLSKTKTFPKNTCF